MVPVISSRKLENISEDSPAANWAGTPETPTESMEFLARSWSLSAVELSKALSTTTHSSIQPSKDSPPRHSQELKELLLLHQDYLSGEPLLKNGVSKSIGRGKTMGRWIKEQKERKKQEMRTQNAELHAAVSVAGVAAAVAALAAETHKDMYTLKTSAAMASAAALVAAHCIDIAQEMGAEHEQMQSVVNSAINARTNGHIMTLTAGAATALRGAATLKSRLVKGQGATAYALTEETGDCNITAALKLASTGGELLKLTRKGDVHWKQVSFNIDSNGQVVAKMKSKYMGGTFTKKKKCVVTRVYYDVPVWPGREGSEERAYFGIKTGDRIIQFECKTKEDKQIWIQGIRLMLNHCAPIP